LTQINIYYQTPSGRELTLFLFKPIGCSIAEMKPIPLHRVAVVRPFTEFLSGVGAPVAREFQIARLPLHALDDVDNFLPSQRFWAFLVNSVASQGIEDLGFRVGRKFGANCIDAHLAEALRNSPTLQIGLSKVSALLNKTVSHSTMGLAPPMQARDARFFHRPGCDARHPANTQIGWYGVSVLLSAIRMFAGSHWCPNEIGVMAQQMPSQYIREQLDGTRLRLSQSCWYIALPQRLLSLPPVAVAANTPTQSTIRCKSIATNSLDSLEATLVAYIQDSTLNIQFAAELCDTSVRSLQRDLATMGTSYTEVLETTRFKLASRMLRDCEVRVADVSSALGYSDPTHFARAFRRIAGASPRTYRRNLQH
jgi:AraC-like DNA-binding protein